MPALRLFGPFSVRFRYQIFLIGVCFTYTPPYIRQKKGQIYHLKCNFFAFLLHFLCNAMIINHQYPTNTSVTVKSGNGVVRQAASKYKVRKKERLSRQEGTERRI